ncbi:recombinase family protein [Petroclostridium sp. X23]|uniref:recombinase family protein n=1 Tax=Petroclostridium sp. X23 TaxID=3045146 RepID=UPI0024ACC08D|nr:recombinase family protein [Petroclostridium sp. X23]WHH58256.1 recombinase family protein [Petroclostridium sp. X23]
MNRVCIYLRKSRADEEAEKHGEGETLAKHRKALLKVAKEMNLNIVQIYEEIVSGESLIHRPKMLELLQDIENKLYDAVLCMDLDRLGRGNMQEQGLILETLKKNNTKVITPRKVYDLHDEFDEEYSEFEAFMARKELKIITRRLQSGRIRSLQEGNYIASVPPYGYDIYSDQKSRTLKENKEQAEIVRFIFNEYVKGNGCTIIEEKLNEMGYKSAMGLDWNHQVIINMIKNPVYIGKLSWKKREYFKEKKYKTSAQRPKNEWIIVDGKHPAIIDEELFYKAQDILNSRNNVPCVKSKSITNPLAGIVICKNCGNKMVLRPYKHVDDQLMCRNKCGNKSSKLKLVEKKVLQGLRDWITKYKSELDSADIEPDNSQIILYEKSLSNMRNELTELHKQKGSLFDFLERGIYDVETFTQRSQIVADRISQTEKNIADMQELIKTHIKQEKAKVNVIPTVEKILEIYDSIEDAENKNKMLKKILDSVIYYKKKEWRNDNFIITIHPKLPK